MKYNSTEAAKEWAEHKLQQRYFTLRWKRRHVEADAMLRQHECLSWDRLTADGSVFIGTVSHWVMDSATRS